MACCQIAAPGDSTRRVDDFGALFSQPALKVIKEVYVENRVDIFDSVDAAILAGKDEDTSYLCSFRCSLRDLHSSLALDALQFFVESDEGLKLGSFSIDAKAMF